MLNIFKRTKSNPYTLESNNLEQQFEQFKSLNDSVGMQNTRSQFAFNKTVYEYLLCEEIKITPNSVGEYQYQFRSISPFTLFMMKDQLVRDIADKKVKKDIKKENLIIPAILDLNNPIHFYFSHTIGESFENNVRKYGLDNLSLKQNGNVMIEQHLSKNLTHNKVIIYISLCFLRDYQASHRATSDLLDSDYFEELIDKLNSFRWIKV